MQSGRNAARVRGSSMVLQTRLSVREGDPLLEEVQRSTRIGERSGDAVRRMLTRYRTLLQNAPLPPQEQISRLHAVLNEPGAGRRALLGTLGYPQLDRLAAIVRDSTIEKSDRIALLNYLYNIPGGFLEYALLIESLELMQ